MTWNNLKLDSSLVLKKILKIGQNEKSPLLQFHQELYSIFGLSHTILFSVARWLICKPLLANVANLESPFLEGLQSGLEAKIVGFFIQKWLDTKKSKKNRRFSLFFLQKKRDLGLNKWSFLKMCFSSSMLPSALAREKHRTDWANPKTFWLELCWRKVPFSTFFCTVQYSIGWLGVLDIWLWKHLVVFPPSSGYHAILLLRITYLHFIPYHFHMARIWLLCTSKVTQHTEHIF